jgi:hypothetical protein
LVAEGRTFLSGKSCVLGGGGTRRENSAGRHCSPLAAGGRHWDTRHACAGIAKLSPNMIPAPSWEVGLIRNPWNELSGTRATGAGDVSAPNVRHLVAAPVSHTLHFPVAGSLLRINSSIRFTIHPWELGRERRVRNKRALQSRFDRATSVADAAQVGIVGHP